MKIEHLSSRFAVVSIAIAFTAVLFVSGCGGSVPGASAAPPAAEATEAVAESSRTLDPAELQTCDQVVSAYTDRVAPPQRCEADAECHILLGACDRGLGSCWYAVRAEVTAAEVLPLVDRFEELGCVGARCRCAAPPANAVCDEGVCRPG